MMMMMINFFCLPATLWSHLPPGTAAVCSRTLAAHYG